MLNGSALTPGCNALRSAMSDAFNNHDGLHVLDQGESYTNSFFIEIE